VARARGDDMSARPRKTYWHLLDARRLPSEYEIVSSRMLYYPQRGFEVNVPASHWYARYQRGSPFACDDWERFADPRETTYAAYTARRARQEAHVDGVLESIHRTGHDATLPPTWRAALERLLPPLLYPWHGLQMVASYVGQMAPAGRIAIAALLQSADEMRRIQRIGYRIAQLRRTWPDFAPDPKAQWLRDPAWQPLREAVERLLVAYDWGESLVALQLCVKPALDELVTTHLANVAQAHSDYPLAEILGSLRQDVSWHREWTRALLATACDDTPSTAAAVDEWVATWRPRALHAIARLADDLESLLPAEQGVVVGAEIAAALDALHPVDGAAFEHADRRA
jgi:toluene monooxygenase system protein E